MTLVNHAQDVGNSLKAGIWGVVRITNKFHFFINLLIPCIPLMLIFTK